MDDFLKESLLKWISLITRTDITFSDLADGRLLIHLIELSNAVPNRVDCQCIKDQIDSFLDGTFNSIVSKLFDIDGVISGKADDLEVFSVCLTVLLGCLQSPSRQSFMDAALDLSLDMQTAIFHLIQVPMTQLSLHHEFTRDLVLQRLLDPLPIMPNGGLSTYLPSKNTYQLEEEILETSSKAFSQVESKSGSDNQRPNNLSLCITPDRNLCITSSQLNLTDASERSTNQGHHMIPHPVSPLTSLKCLLDSPSLTHKTQLRESEREKRRDEAESIVAGLRRQVEEAAVRVTESESRALRLSRELTALHDQGDELVHCRSELALREEEIKNLKLRVNGFQDLMTHLRKLEMEKVDLQQECEDLRLKVDQQLCQLREFKDRRIKCSEIEELTSKLRDVEAQLAQQLREREMIEKDTRQQHELLSQIKIQYSVRNHTNESSNINQSTGNIEEIECDEQITTTSAMNENAVQRNEIVLILEDDLKSARLFISKLQLQFDEELGSAKQLLEEKTKRLYELENIISTRIALVKTDVAVQTEISPTTTVDAFSASAADRRGLSDELVRLHEEIVESRSYARELEQRLSETEEDLRCTKDKLIYQTTLSNRNQQNWIMIEQEYRELQRENRMLRNDLLSTEENLSRAEAAPESVEFEATCVNYEKKIDLLNRQLLETTFECRRLEAERARVAERNSDLQRELETTRILVDSLKQKSEGEPIDHYHDHPRNSASMIQVYNHDYNHNHHHRRRGSHYHNSVFPKNSRVNRRHLNDSLEDWEDSDHDGNLSHSQHIQSSIYPYETKNTINYHDDCSSIGVVHSQESLKPKSCKVNGNSNYDEELVFSKRKHHSKLRTDSKQLSRLASRTQELEEYAMKLREKFNQHQSSTQVNSLVGVYPNLTEATHNKQITSPKIAQNQKQLDNRLNEFIPNGDCYEHEQDTDADSSAYTDLSQVSPVSQPVDSGCQNTKLTTSNAQTNTEYFIDQPVLQLYSQPIGCISTTSSKNSRNSPPLSSDPNRLKELHLRNRLQPSHLRSSYPVETQVINTNDIVGTLSQITTDNNVVNKSLNRIKNRTHKGNHITTNNKESSMLNGSNDQSVTHNTTITNTSRPIPSTLSVDHKKTSYIKSIQEKNTFDPDSTPSPLAAGYQPLPKDIQSFSEALISASVDSKAMNYVLTTHPNLIKSVVSDKEINNCKSYSSSSGIQNVHMLPHADRKIEFRNSIPEALPNRSSSRNQYETHNTRGGGELSSDNENVNPPHSSTMIHRRLTDAGLFIKPLNPVQNHRNKKAEVYPTDRNGVSPTNSVQSVDDLSGASSIRSSKSSIAFEIKNDDHKTSVRRLPSQLPSSHISSKTRKLGQSKHLDGTNQRINCKPAFSESKLVVTPIISQRHIAP
ncbi:unnamed protein product [Heterobilharzia americana]|nr:unnamed protein product [Heterobilharzia americana]